MQKLKKKGCEEYGKIFKNINTEGKLVLLKNKLKGVVK